MSRNANVYSLTTCGKVNSMQVYFLPSVSRKSAEMGVPNRAPMDERLPNNAISVSLIGRCRVVFVDEKSLRVEEGHAYIRPMAKHE